MYKVPYRQIESLTDPGLWLEVVVWPWPEAEVAGSRLAVGSRLEVVVAAHWPESIPRQGPRPFLGPTVGALVLKKHNTKLYIPVLKKKQKKLTG